MTSPPGSTSNVPDAETGDSDKSSATRFRVAVFAVPDVREKLMPVLVRIPGIAALDARIRLFDLPGVLPEHFDGETADLLVQEFHSAGVEAVRCLEAEFPTLEHRQAIHHARCDSNGLELLKTGGTTEMMLPWADLALVSIGEVPVEHSHHITASPTAVIHAAPGVRGSRIDSPAAHGPEMWLVQEGPFQAWRIDHLEMNYEYLGDRMSTSAAVNFRVFAQDIADHAKAAYLTPSTRAYLETQRAEDYRFDSRGSHASAVQLHVLMRRNMGHA